MITMKYINHKKNTALKIMSIFSPFTFRNNYQNQSPSFMRLPCAALIHLICGDCLLLLLLTIYTVQYFINLPNSSGKTATRIQRLHREDR